MLIIPFSKKHCQDDDSSWIMEDGEKVKGSEKSIASESKDANVNENIIMNVTLTNETNSKYIFRVALLKRRK